MCENLNENDLRSFSFKFSHICNSVSPPFMSLNRCRERRVAEDWITEATEEVRREVDRRQTWIDEEKERYFIFLISFCSRRRILEDVMEDFQEDITREVQRREAIFLEEKARDESQEMEKRRTDAPTQQDLKQDELHEVVQQQFMAKIHRKEAREEEEKEKISREVEDELQERFASEMDRRYTWILEERERVRRIVEVCDCSCCCNQKTGRIDLWSILHVF